MSIVEQTKHKMLHFHSIKSHPVGLVISVSASHAVGSRFAPRTGHTKDYHKNGTNCLPAWHECVRVGV